MVIFTELFSYGFDKKVLRTRIIFKAVITLFVIFTDKKLCFTRNSAIFVVLKKIVRSLIFVSLIKVMICRLTTKSRVRPKLFGGFDRIRIQPPPLFPRKKYNSYNRYRNRKLTAMCLSHQPRQTCPLEAAASPLQRAGVSASS